MHPEMMPERRRLLDRLIREIYRGEMQAADHAGRTEKQIGLMPPVFVLRDVARHAATMRERFDVVVRGYDLQALRSGLTATLSNLRGLVADRLADPERAYRTCLLDLRHGIDVVKLAREVARAEELFGIIRWCDDWLGARRALVARVEAQLVWFVEAAGVECGIPPAPSEIDPPRSEPEAAGTTIALSVDRHEQEEASPEHRLGMHPSRTT
jgi:hypothetical protein